ncbi:DUF58 domain-containing protein [Salinilacihabitans rarus]|uniref:DUF58 domain-containing protein n=1 Tax=Salinilacihabitans rarus TaxID=2961596 RepID=UPI0020C8ACFE|nr:DUF58 domain-containing protein [Salinilacihabitans rarus]
MTAMDRWRVGLAVALVAVGVGVLVENAAIFLSSVVGLTYAAYGHATGPPPTALSAERAVDPTGPAPGERVDVRLTVTNDGDVPVPDVRVADAPPADLAVEGTPRAAASLAPGESVTVEYAVRARRGEYDFGDATAVVRNVSGSERETERFPLADRVECDDLVERLPLAGETIQHAGRVETDAGGEGIEFHSIRAFQPSDPMSRVDWNRLARTGELTTIEFREERAAAVAVVVDRREATAVVRRPGELDARELTRHAAERLATALLDENNRVGVALYGGRGDYLLPRSGRDQTARVERLLAGEWCGSFGREGWLADAHRSVDRFCRHLADEKQLVFVTPLLDDDPADSARRFRAYGHEVTVVSPAVADDDGAGGTVERLDRARRISSLRDRGVRVVEWAPDEPLHAAVDRGTRRWSR